MNTIYDLVRFYQQYECTELLDRLWPTFIVPELALGRFIQDSKDWLKEDKRNKISIKYLSQLHKYEIILSCI
jgi:hypothetical protein